MYTVQRTVYNSHCFNINIYSKLNIERTFIEAVVGGWTWYVQYPMWYDCVLCTIGLEYHVVYV